MLAESTRVWGYQTNYGSYCQFARAQAHQCLPKPPAVTWEEAGCFLLCGSTPRIVFEHPGEATLPTSGFVCATGGMVVICAGTTGYNVTLDLRHHWMRQKRFQGSHLSNDQQAAAVTRLVESGAVSPNLSGTFAFDEIGECHQLMLEHKHPFGNMGVLVNAPAVGLGATGSKRDAVSA